MAAAILVVGLLWAGVSASRLFVLGLVLACPLMLLTTHGAALLGLGVSISLDELAIGFSLGLARPPTIPVIIAIGGQAFVAAQLGLRLGARVGERLRKAAERIAGIVLIALGLFLIAERLLA